MLSIIERMPRAAFTGKMLLIIIASIVFNLFTGTEASCTIPLSPEHGSLHLLGGSQVNSIALYSCSKGWKLVGAPSSECLITGEWTFPSPKCISTVIQHKNESSKPMSANKDILSNITTRKPEIELEKSCDAPKHPENGMVTYTTLNVGSELKFECDNGYHLQDTGPVYCTSDGEWSKADVKCVAKTCDRPKHPKNGQVSFESRTFRSKLKFKCDHGYFLKSDEPVFCTQDGTWSNTDVQCVAKACDRPEHPENGQVIFTSLNFGSQLKFVCDNGYILKSDEPVFCTSDGTWSKTDVQCIAITCDNPEHPENGMVVLTSLNFRSQLKYKCDDGYLLMPNEPVFCTSAGTWSRSDVQCVDLPTTPSPIQNNCSCTYNSHDRKLSAEVNGLGLWNGDKVRKGDKMTLRCYDPTKHLVLPNATRISGTLALTCNVCRIWQDSDLPSCEDVGSDSCVLSAVPNGSLGYIENRRVSRYKTEERFIEFQVGRIFKHDETAIFRCKDGFTPIENLMSSEGLRRSDEVVTCKDGQWSQSLECKSESCYGEPPPMDNGYPVVNDRSHGTVIYYHCNKYYVKATNGMVKCHYGQWIGHTPTCIDGRCYASQLNHPGLEKLPVDFIEYRKDYPAKCKEGFKASSKSIKVSCDAGKWNVPEGICVQVNNVITPASPKAEEQASSQPENCFCTFNPGSEILLAVTNGQQLEYGGPIRKGDAAVIFCRALLRQHLFWPNGMRTFAVNMTCKVCGVWGSNDLPSCQLTHPGDSFIILNEDMEVQPGGRVECNLGKELKLDCISWNINYPDWTEPRNLPVSYSMGVVNENYTAFQSYLHIQNFGLQHVGSYECSARTPRRLYRSTKLDLVTRTSVSDKVAPNPPASEESKSEEDCVCIYNGNWRLKALLNGQRIWRGTSIRKGESIQLGCVDEGRRLTLPNGTMIMFESVIWTCYRCGSEGAIEMFTCEEVQRPKNYCEIPKDPENGEVFYKSLNVGSELSFACNNGYNLQDTEPVYCTSDGEWSKTDVKCVAVTCSRIVVTEGMTIKYANGWRTVGSTARFQCRAPFVLLGPSTLRCLQTGEWNSVQPICRKPEVLCPPIPETGDVSVHFTNSRKINSTAHFRCKDANFKIVRGFDTRTCLSSGEWSGANPDCEATGCLIGDFADTAPINLLPSMEDVTEELQPVGSELAMHCEKGWVLIEGKTAKCGPLGTWDFGKAQCVLGCHLNLEDEESEVKIEPIKEYYRFGESIIVSCPNGFKPTSDVQRVVCIGTKWSDSIPNCREIWDYEDYYE